MALPYEIFIGLRYLRAKRRNRTISFNTVVSITGITLGVAALIGTVGIMTGFKEDIQSKILGTTAHILVHDRTKEAMTDYDAQVKRVEEVPDVVAAALRDAAAAHGYSYSVSAHENIGAAYLAARERAAADDRILAFGSFLAVAEVMRVLRPSLG